MSTCPINLKGCYFVYFSQQHPAMGGILCILFSSNLPCKKCKAESLPLRSIKVMLQRKSLIIVSCALYNINRCTKCPFLVFRTKLCLQKTMIERRWSAMVIGIFVILRFLRRPRALLTCWDQIQSIREQ